MQVIRNAKISMHSKNNGILEDKQKIPNVVAIFNANPHHLFSQK